MRRSPMVRAIGPETAEICGHNGRSGSDIGERHVGNFGHIATYSFFGNKTITTGEGGMVTTDDETLHDRMVHYKGQGLAKHRQYWHDVVGYNYRMTNI